MKWYLVSFFEMLFFQTTCWVFIAFYIVDFVRFVRVLGQKSMHESFLSDCHQNHVLIYSKNVVIDVNNFIFVGSLFHILGPRAHKLLLP